MKAILMRTFGSPDVLFIGDAPKPELGVGELLVQIKATALNRADLLQRRGLYPPPQGESEILGLEMAGIVVAVGPHTTGRISVGQRVCALLGGGGYAQYCVIPEGMAMPIPDSVSDVEAAAIPEAFLTAYLNLFKLGHLERGETVLVHAGASGVGTSALQLIREVGAVSLVTAGSAEKIDVCRELGATAGWNYKEGPFLPWVRAQTADKGVDMILDFVGASYFSQNIAAMGMDGRMLVIGTLGGVDVENLNLGYLLRNRLSVIGTALRSRTDKVAVTQAFWADYGEAIAGGRVKPMIDKVFAWTAAAEAHAHMEANANTGKIVLEIGG